MQIRNVPETTLKSSVLETEWLARVLLFAALTGIGAIIRFPLSPVPLTMQVFFVLLSGMVLGPVWGPVSQLAYLAMGLCGAPFFAAPPHAGPTVLFGPTGGYLWGFVLASGITGLISVAAKRRACGKRTAGIALLILASLAGIASIYSTGTGWLAIWLGTRGRDASLAFALGVKPFIVADALKAALAVCAAGPFLKRTGWRHGATGA